MLGMNEKMTYRIDREGLGLKLDDNRPNNGLRHLSPESTGVNRTLPLTGVAYQVVTSNTMEAINEQQYVQ
jgi:hypothetical protein